MVPPVTTQSAPILSALCALVFLAFGAALPAQFGANYRDDAIRYGSHTTHDKIAKLQQGIKAGKVNLRFDDRTGYLPALLAHLSVPVTSQTLVFSKTSFQIHKIAPGNPRAVYFGDEVYVGYVPTGSVLEITAMDAQRGPIFYTLDQTQAAKPKIVRRTSDCLTCHGGSRTANWPGHLIRSVYTKPTGDIETRTGSFVTTQTSPFEKRWGGWYVTGTHGTMRHMGNSKVTDSTLPVKLDLEKGANLTDLSSRFPTRQYLSPHSDIVALMVLEHQTEMHNLIAQATYRVRVALHRQRSKNRILKLPLEQIDQHTTQIIRDAASKVLEYMLCKNEQTFPSPIRGTSKFSDEFSALGPKDPKGRSLRELDLNKRLFRYPCSYLIYSPSFDAMPKQVLERVYLRLWRILTGMIGRHSWRLTRNQRQAILDILLATKHNLPASFKPTVVR